MTLFEYFGGSPEPLKRREDNSPIISWEDLAVYGEISRLLAYPSKVVEYSRELDIPLEKTLKLMQSGRLRLLEWHDEHHMIGALLFFVFGDHENLPENHV